MEFRAPYPLGYVEGKWFALSHADAVGWGRSMQRFSGSAQAFRVAAFRFPASLLSDVEYRSRLDAIGPAYLVRNDQLRAFTEVGSIIVFEQVYNVQLAP